MTAEVLADQRDDTLQTMSHVNDHPDTQTFFSVNSVENAGRPLEFRLKFSLEKAGWPTPTQQVFLFNAEP